MLKPGLLIDEKYRVVRLLGAGSFGKVYLAVNIRTGRKWAVKEIQKESKERKGGWDLIQNEIEILKRLNHRNLAAISDFYELKDAYLIFTDYLEGDTLDRYQLKYFMQKGRNVPAAEIIRIAKELCEVLCYLQEKGVIHGDIKPSNIIMTKDGTPVLIDFGGSVHGADPEKTRLSFRTPGYSPPEAEWGKAGLSTDVYSLGAVVYKLLVGELPGEGSNLYTENEVIRKRIQNERILGKKEKRLLADLYRITKRCLQPEPSGRYLNAFSLLEELNALPDRKTALFLSTQKTLLMPALVLVLIFGSVSVYGGNMKTVYRNKAYQSCLTEAKHCVKEEAAEYYRLAIMLEPSRKEGYLGLIDTLASDNELTGEDDAALTKAMNAVEYDRSFSNEESLRTNEEDYFDVAYRFGITYYYCFSDLQKTAALKYLSGAAETNLDPEGEDAFREEQKKRSDILIRMIRYENNIGLPDKRGENEISYTDYWKDMKALIRESMEAENTDLTLFWICMDVLNRILNDAASFLNEGISMEELKRETDEIKLCVTMADSVKGIQAEKLKTQIKEMLPLVYEKLEAEAFKVTKLSGGVNDR